MRWATLYVFQGEDCFDLLKHVFDRTEVIESDPRQGPYTPLSGFGLT